MFNTEKPIGNKSLCALIKQNQTLTGNSLGVVTAYLNSGSFLNWNANYELCK